MNPTAARAAGPPWQGAQAERAAALARGKPLREAEQRPAIDGNGDNAEWQGRLDDTWFRVALLFRPRQLTCLVVIDIKVGRFG